MDYLTRQLLLELTRLREAFSKQNSTISAINERASKHEQFQRKWLDDISSKYEQLVRNNSIQKKREQGISNSARKATWLAAIATVVAAAGAWWYASISHGMWKEMRTQTGKTEKQFRGASRPWLFPSVWELPLKVTPGSTCPQNGCFGFYVINTGKGPALDVRAGANISTVGPITGNVQVDLIRDVLANESKEPLWFEKPITSDQLKAPHFYAQCRIRYCDIWDDLHETNFCIQHERGRPAPEFWPCKEGGDDQVLDFPGGCKKGRSKDH